MRSRTDILVQEGRGPVYHHSLKPSKQQHYPLQENFYWYMENPAFHVELVIFPRAPPLPQFSSLFNNRRNKRAMVPFPGCVKRSLIKAANSTLTFCWGWPPLISVVSSSAPLFARTGTL